jgi:ribosomal protein S18 acetylase RimI-like enzyme
MSHILSVLSESDDSTRSFKTIDDLSTHWEKERGVRNTISERPKYDQIHLHDVEVPKEHRNRGIGSEFMRDLTRHADEHGKTITLQAAKDLGATSLNRLKSFYRGHGFVNNKGRKKDYRLPGNMYRRPQR